MKVVVIAASVAALAVVACDSSRPAPRPRPASPAPSAPSDAAASLVPSIPVPGAIWFVDDTTLGRLAGGVRLDVPIGGEATLYPSRTSLPDGRLVAIASRGDGSAESEQVALVGADGKVTRIGPSAATVRDPAVDPRGRWIVVAATLDGHSDLYKLELASKTATRLTNDPQGNFSPVTLANDAIGFASSRDGDSEIYRFTSDGKAQRLTAFHKDDWSPVASLDGATLAFLSDREGPVRIFAMAPDGTNQHRVTTRAADAGDELDPTWSRDGKLAYLVERAGRRGLQVLDPATGAERELTPAGASDADPSFSPDGAWVVVSRETAAKGRPTTALWAIRIADGAPVQLTDRGTPRVPRWH